MCIKAAINAPLKKLIAINEIEEINHLTALPKITEIIIFYSITQKEKVSFNSTSCLHVVLLVKHICVMQHAFRNLVLQISL